jgi:hypothetical protein
MYTIGAMKYDEMTPYVNITILFVKFSGEILEERLVDQILQARVPAGPES